jgi:8-amino-3,8-dideoxy-alpha-D-manno-octulosonate transaminase
MKIKWPNEFPGVYWLDKQEENAVLDVLHNGSLFRYYGLGEPDYVSGTGKPHYVDTFEAAARSFYGCDYALAMNSGTGALITAMTALNIGPGCEVVVPSFMWVATVGAIVQCNAIPVLCEVDESFCMSPDDLEKVITPRTGLILPIHMAGAPCNMERIMEIADKNNIPVLEDCAQCNGGSYKGKKVGTFGAMAIFSLQLIKNITSGEGGLLITNDEKLYTRAFSSHDMGLIRVDGRLATPEPYAVSWGAGRRMMEMCGAIANVQIGKLPDIVNHMRGSKQRIKDMLNDVPGITFRKLNDTAGDTGPFIIMILKNETKALSVVESLKQSGVHSTFRIADYGLHIYSNIPSLITKTPLSKAGNPWNLEQNTESVYDYNYGACPKSDVLFARSVLVPIPSKLTPEQESEVATIIKTAVNN